LSRPCLELRTRPAFSINRRCLVMAWRVTCEPSVRFVMDSGPAPQRRATSRKRVSSPKAANIGADVGFRRTRGLRGLRKVLLDHLDHHVPTGFVCRERFRTSREWNLIKAGLDHRKHNAVFHLLQ